MKSITAQPQHRGQRLTSLWDFMSEMERTFEPGFADANLVIPAVDVKEDKDNYRIMIDLPGIKDEDVTIEVADGRLSVRGERSREDQKKEGMFTRYERAYGHFERSFQLPQNVDESQIKANFEKGELEIVIPKTEHAKPRNVQIGARSKSSEKSTH